MQNPNFGIKFLIIFILLSMILLITTEANAVSVRCVSLFHTKVKCRVGKASRFHLFFCVCLFVAILS